MTCFLLLCLFVQDSAEATYKKIDSVLIKAETLRIQVKGKAVLKRQENETSYEVEGVILIKGNDKLRITLSVKDGNEPPEKLEFVANGSKMRGPKGTILEAPSDLRSRVCSVFKALGAVAATNYVFESVGNGFRGEAPKPSTSNVASKSAGILEFDANYDG